MNKELITNELAMYGILVKDTQCTVFENGKQEKRSAHDQYQRLLQSVSEKRALLKELWLEVIRDIVHPPVAISAGSERTGRMFTEAVKHMYQIAWRRSLPEHRFIKALLARDINSFSESFMSKIIDMKLGIDWVTHMMCADAYRLKLLKAIGKIHLTDKEASISGPWANLDLPWEERVWSYNDEGENLDDRDQEKQKQERYQLPSTYNDPYDFEEGFYYREMRNEPYAWGDEDNNPYPHRDLLWDELK